MSKKSFRALVVREAEDRAFVRQIEERKVDDLPAGDVLIRVCYSSLNYKDALSASGNRGVTKHYPHTPGIDAAGVVEESSVPVFKTGEKVIVTGYDLGMNRPGGFGEYIRVPSEWVLMLPEHLSLKESMIYGTAGFTAALSVHKLEHVVKPGQGDILVTGATGGVGSIALSLLVKDGYSVVAVSGKTPEIPFLRDRGAKEVMSRDEATDTSDKPLLKARWAGVVDTVGGDILASAIKQTQYGGAVTCCGNVASPDLSLTVYPFILRGIHLLGVDSANCPMERRQKIWHRLSRQWKLDHLDRLATEVSLGNLNVSIDDMLEGTLKGRTVVKVTTD